MAELKISINTVESMKERKRGYLYECYDLQDIESPTQINCAYTCTEPVRVDAVTEISDLYEYYMEQVQKGLFYIKQNKEISEKEMDFVFRELKKDVEKHELKSVPEHPMSIFV